MSDPLSIQLLGNFRLHVGNTLIDTINTPRLQALFAFLVLHHEAPQSRQRLAFQLWPDSSESQARTNLRKLFFQLQHALPDAEHFFYADSQNIGWNAKAAFTLDVAHLQQQLAHLQQEPLDLAALRQVVALYQGELLPSCYEDWITPLRQQLHQAVMTALERLITLLENQRAYTAGIEYARRLLTFDPLEEKSYQRLMRLHALDGDYTGALRVYQDCVAMLQNELEVEPAAETQDLYERLRRRDTTLIAKPEPKPQQADNLPLIGRQHEWQTLQQAWRQAVQGQVQFVCITGEAGIGKTRLAEELLEWAGRQGVITGRAHAYATQSALAYAPVTALLRSPHLRPRLAKLGDLWLAQVSRLLPELLEAHPQLSPPKAMTESWQRQRFFEALARAVLVDEQPRLLLLDDLQWCDLETLEWLQYLLNFATQARLLVIGTVRSGVGGPNHPLTTLLLNLRRLDRLTELALVALTEAEVTQLATQVAGRTLAVEQTEQLFEDTDGNPLFVVETVRAGFNKQATAVPTPDPGVTFQPESGQESTLPPKIYAVIQSRLTQLSPQAQDLAGVAAVIGRSFTYPVLVEASHQDEDRVVESLDELWQQRIIQEQAGEAYNFCHDKLCEVVYSQISRARRRLLHRRVAQTLERRQDTESANKLAAMLAYHYFEAGQQEKAIEYMLIAGDQARALYANAEAERFYQSAVKLLEEQGQQELAAKTLLKLGLLFTATFAPQKAQAAYDQAFALWKPLNTNGDLRHSALPPAVLRVAIGEPVSLDPAKTYDSDSAFLMAQLFEGLVETDDEHNVVPALATHWEVTEGGARYRFFIRPDARWSDGAPITAHHFAYAWRRNLHPTTQAPAVHLLYCLENAQAFHEGTLRDPKQIGVRALNDSTLQIDLAGPTAYFPYLLAHPITYPLPPWVSITQGDAWGTTATLVTNGAYRLSAWQPGKQLTLERNSYYSRAFPGNAAQIEGIVFKEWAQGLQAYARHELDLVDMATANAQTMTQTRVRHGAELVYTPNFSATYLIFRTDRPPFSDRRVRQAFCQAINRNALNREVEQQGQLPATGGMIPPGIPGHSPAIGLRYEPTQARQLLAAAGYPNGQGFPALTFLHTHGLGNESFLTFLCQSWQQVLGLTITVTTVAWTPFQTQLAQDPPDLMLGGWVADYPDPDNFLRVLFHSHQGLNEPRWRHARFDALVEEALRVTVPEQRLALYQTADRLLVNEEAVILPLSYGQDVFLVKPWVHHVDGQKSYTRRLKEMLVKRGA